MPTYGSAALWTKAVPDREIFRMHLGFGQRIYILIMKHLFTIVPSSNFKDKKCVVLCSMNRLTVGKAKAKALELICSNGLSGEHFVAHFVRHRP